MRAGSCREISGPVWEASEFSARSHTPARRGPSGLGVPVRERAENFKRLLMRGGNFVGSWRFSSAGTCSSHLDDEKSYEKKPNHDDQINCGGLALRVFAAEVIVHDERKTNTQDQEFDQSGTVVIVSELQVSKSLREPGTACHPLFGSENFKYGPARFRAVGGSRVGELRQYS